MTSVLTEDDLNYLVGLVRQNMRRLQKTLDSFDCRPGQARQEAASVRAGFEVRQEYHASVAAKLRLMLEAARDEDEFPVVCENGCPEGYLGRHKFSCPLARGRCP